MMMLWSVQKQERRQCNICMIVARYEFAISI
jgi:hypothetical protein